MNGMPIPHFVLSYLRGLPEYARFMLNTANTYTRAGSNVKVQGTCEPLPIQIHVHH